jgi:hypothetical protein
MAYPPELDAGRGGSGAGRLAFPALALSRPRTETFAAILGLPIGYAKTR